MFSDVKRTTWAVIITMSVAASVLVVGTILAFRNDVFTPVFDMTGGLLNNTLLANIHLVAFVVVGIMFMWGKLGPRDVGLRGERLGTGLVLTIVLWLLAQLIIVAWYAVAGGPLNPNPLWERGVTVVLGLLVAQLLGNALYEEIAFRGFLLPQLYHKMERWRDRPALRLGGAVLLSVTMFALIHIPIRVCPCSGIPLNLLPQSLLWVAMLGVVFAIIYLRTGNLFFTVGAHALYNTPTMLLVSDFNSSYAVMGMALVITAVWPYAARLGRGSLQARATYGTKGV